MAAIWVESLMSMPTPPSVPLPLPPAETSIIDDLPCRSCGYNLRTLATGGLCPECSTPVSASLGGELLRHADPNWLSDMNTAGQWVRGGTFVLYAFWVVLPPFPFIRHVFEAAAAAIIMAGTWQLTVADPSGIGENRCGWVRTCCRGLGIVQFALGLLTSFPTPLTGHLIFLWRGTQLIALLAWGFFVLEYLSRMAPRLRKPHVARVLRILIFLFTSSSALLLTTWISRYAGLPLGKLTWAKILSDRPLPFVSLLFVFQGLTTFLSALKDEVAAATRPTRPTMWRTAGAFIYWIRQFFRSKNGDSQ